MTLDPCKDASQTLQDQKFTLLMQRNPLGVIEWNNQFKVVEWNLAAEQIFGYSQAEVIGHHAAGLIVPESAKAQINQVMEALLQQQGGACSINENLTKDGNTIICEWYNTPLIDAEGKVLGVMSMVQDITDRQRTELKLKQAKQDLEIKVGEKTATLNQTISQLRQEIREHEATLEEYRRMEAALNQSQTTYQALLSAMPDLVLRLDSDEICLDYMLTKSFRSAPQAEWRGKHVREVMPTHFADRRSHYIQQALKTGDVQCYEQEIEVEGAVQTEEVRIAACGDREVLVIIRDVSERARIEAERKKAEQQVQEVQEFLHSILNSIPDPIFVKNAHHQWVLINEAFCDLMGQPRAALIGKSDYDILPQEQADKVWEKDHFVLTTHETEVNEEYVMDNEGGLRIISTKKTSVVDAHGDRFLIGSIRDITSYHDVLNALRQSEERFQRLATNIPGIIYQFRLTPDGQFAFPYVSAFSEKLWELDPELVQHNADLALDQLHPDDRDSFLAGVTSSAETLQPWEWLGRMITPSGKLKWVQGILAQSYRLMARSCGMA